MQSISFDQIYSENICNIFVWQMSAQPPNLKCQSDLLIYSWIIFIKIEHRRDLLLKMDKIVCWVCHKRTQWFYGNMLLVRTKHSQKSISAIMKIILGEEYEAVWCLNESAGICLKCVDRINQYDGACEELQKMKEDMKSMICANIIPKLANADPSNTPTDNVITNANEVDAKKIDLDEEVGDITLVSSDGRVNIEPPEPPQNDHEDSIVKETVTHKIPSKRKTLDFYCEQCKKSFRSKSGLMVRRRSQRHSRRLFSKLSLLFHPK